MSNFVENGFEVVNVDNGKLEELRRHSNTLDCGAIKILESLDLFCEDLVDGCEYSNQVSYRKLFNSLRTVIKSAYENERVRNAVMTGIIRDTPTIEDKTTKHKTAEKTSGIRNKELNEDEVRNYSCNHTLSESAAHFGISRQQMKSYVYWHDIKFIADKDGRKGTLDKDKVLKVSAELTVKELAALFNVKVGTMAKYCKRNNIPHKTKGGTNV